MMPVPVSATLAINEKLAALRRDGRSVLPLGFGEAGLPVHPALRAALAEGSDANAYGPVAGSDALRQAAAGYWSRRGLPTDPELVVAAPGSKPLLYSLVLALRCDIVLPSPSWVSYAAQTVLAGHRALHVPVPPGEGGLPDPDLLEPTIAHARGEGRKVGAVVVTTPDNPTGAVPSAATMQRLVEVARALDIVIISDEIYHDLAHAPETTVHSAAEFAPERTVITTGLSKNLALGGWRIGMMRLPDSPVGARLQAETLGIASEIWSSPPAPVQYAAAYALSEPPEIKDRIERSRHLHGAVVRAVAARFARAGATFPEPRGAFYLYPDFGAWSEELSSRHGITTGRQLAAFLLDRYRMGVLPGAEFEDEGADPLRMRVATSLLYGETAEHREQALAADVPTALPWIRAHLDRLEEILDDVAPPVAMEASQR